MKKKVTIQDIADALGISRNTVSKAINNSEGLAEATREKILQKAVEMGYKQFSYFSTFISASDTSPAITGYQGEIALLTSAFLTQSHFASTMLDKFQREISQLGYTMNTHRVTDANLRDKSLPLSFRPEQVRAIICIEMFDRAYDEMVCELGIPVLFVDGPAKQDGFSLPADQLYMDNSTEIMRFVNDMLSQGKKRIGFIGNYHHCQSFFERYAAFRCAMLMAGAEVDEDCCVCYNHQDEIAERLDAIRVLPDVFICANDFVAGDAMRALFSIGKTVPEDVRLLGFDDSAESRLSRPALSTVHIHTQIMAFTAVQLLMSRIHEPLLDYRIVHTQTDLIYRESTRFDGGEETT
ncbi:MAG: LacI family DNA-binding transcriptional regulator [Oscillospiraceae bacterium]|nr:LacI family DNA-binding transcriptional regulator [Oscillospiraceae bacterium]